jgi:hypothetical protein
MKFILLVLTVIVLIVVNGCASRGGGVDHGEHPGDLEHGDTMQK